MFLDTSTSVDLSYIEDTLADIELEVSNISDLLNPEFQEDSSASESSSELESMVSSIDSNLTKLNDSFIYIYAFIGIIAGILLFSIFANRFSR